MWICVIYVNSSYIIIFVTQNKKTGLKFYLFQLCHLPKKRQSAMSPLPPAKKGSRQRALCHLPKKAVGKEILFKKIRKAFADCRQRGCATSSHDGVRSLCRLPYWQVAKALPTDFLLAGGKGFFADEFFATCSLPTATCKAVGKAFTTCFRAFADCFWQSAKNRIPVVNNSSRTVWLSLTDSKVRTNDIYS